MNLTDSDIIDSDSPETNEFDLNVLHVLWIVPVFLIFVCFVLRRKGFKISFLVHPSIRKSKSWPSRRGSSIDCRTQSHPAQKVDTNPTICI